LTTDSSASVRSPREIRCGWDGVFELDRDCSGPAVFRRRKVRKLGSGSVTMQVQAREQWLERGAILLRARSHGATMFAVARARESFTGWGDRGAAAVAVHRGRP
jgi:hypothetical protein